MITQETSIDAWFQTSAHHSSTTTALLTEMEGGAKLGNDTMLTDAELGEIELRLNNSTPGPWCHRDQFIETDAARGQLLGVTMQRDEDGLDRLPGNANACFIAHARADIPRLISEIRRLNELLATQQRPASK